MELNYEKLRRDIMEYYGTAFGDFPIALIDVISVERASDEELFEIAQKLKLDLREYFT